MPFIECHIAAGLPQERRRQLIRDIVAVAHEAIDSDPKFISVVLHEHPAANLCVAGCDEGEAADERSLFDFIANKG